MDEKAHDSMMTMAMCPGMTLRDWFAGLAMSRLAAGAYDALGIWNGQEWDQGQVAASCAYAQADAMLKERDKTRDETDQDSPEGSK